MWSSKWSKEWACGLCRLPQMARGRIDMLTRNHASLNVLRSRQDLQHIMLS